ncbi:MAG: heavy metal translocating P-type ATPase [Desulfurococcaceae archaeon]
MNERGVIEVKVSVVSKLVKVAYNPFSLSKGNVVESLRRMGLKPVESLDRDAQGKFTNFTPQRRVVGFVLGSAVLLLGMSSMSLSLYIGNIELLLVSATVAALLLGYDILMRGLKGLARGSPVMDSLIAFSTISTFSAGLLAHLGIYDFGHLLHVSSFLEASAGIMGFTSIGRYLEERLKRRAFKSLEDLANSIYGKARVVTENQLIERPVSEVVPGEVVEVKSGEFIPVDGIVVEGEGYVDESTFTGESLPALKKSASRDPVLAGSILVSRYLRVRTTRASKDTLLYYIVETVKEAQFYKPSISRLADRVVGVFTWIVIGVALLTLLYWWILGGSLEMGVIFTAAVLTVACPCALGLAIPMTVSIAVLRASRRGVLIRAGDVFERIVKGNSIIFDKTGTLTVGKPVLVEIHKAKNIDTGKLMKYICGVESKSEHAISKAIVEYCRSRGIELDSDGVDYEYFPGMGVIGGIKDVGKVVIGNAELHSKMGIDLNGEVLERVRDIGRKGRTPVIVSFNSEVEAVLEVGDRLREDAQAVIKELKKRGYRVGIASGDIKESVEYYAGLLGVDFYYYGLKPDEKADLIKDLLSKGVRTIYVGDGINDAVAITSSYLGVAMGESSDVSKEAGDAILASNRLSDIIFMIELSRAVRGISLQNLLWALVYNVLMIPLAAGAAFYTYGLFIRPELAALAMILSDISVVSNSLRVLAKNLTL